MSCNLFHNHNLSSSQLKQGRWFQKLVKTMLGEKPNGVPNIYAVPNHVLVLWWCSLHISWKLSQLTALVWSLYPCYDHDVGSMNHIAINMCEYVSPISVSSYHQLLKKTGIHFMDSNFQSSILLTSSCSVIDLHVYSKYFVISRYKFSPLIHLQSMSRYRLYSDAFSLY